MYNRYIPQNDGTYRRKPMEEPARPSPQPRQDAPPRPPETSVQIPPPPPCQSCIHHPAPRRPQSPSRPPESIGSFLKQLLPRGFDTEDLIVVLLLLLMAGDNGDEPNSALLTLALYLFL